MEEELRSISKRRYWEDGGGEESQGDALLLGRVQDWKNGPGGRSIGSLGLLPRNSGHRTEQCLEL